MTYSADRYSINEHNIVSHKRSACKKMFKKVAFSPLSKNRISSETEILHRVDDLFYPQHLHHQQKCCFSRGLLGRAVGVSYACRLFSMCDTAN